MSTKEKTYDLQTRKSQHYAANVAVSGCSSVDVAQVFTDVTKSLPSTLNLHCILC